MSKNHPMMRRPFCCIRLSDFHTCGFRNGMEEEWLALFRRFPSVCDGVWFATCYGYPTLETHARCAEKIATIASRFRKEGIACSLQVSNTIGHGYALHLDNRGVTWDGPIVGPDGTKSTSCHCPLHPDFQAYVANFVHL